MSADVNAGNDEVSSENQDDIDIIESIATEIEEYRERRPQPRLWVVAFRYVVAATTALLLTVISPATRLWQNDGTLHKEYVFQVVLVYVLTLVSLACVMGSDPGYLDAETVARVCQEDGLTLLGYEEDDETDEHQESLTLSYSSSSLDSDVVSQRKAQEEDSLSQHHHQDVAICFKGTRRKVCETCGFAPPLRAHHCRICDKCVATFDHHCTFIGTCIGERNHCRFWWFLTIQLVGFIICSHTVSSSTLRMKNEGYLLIVLAKLYLYPLTIVAAGMWITHSLFALMNLTTFECGKGPRHVDYLRGTRTMDVPFSKVRG